MRTGHIRKGRSWRWAFGEDYAVPAEIEALVAEGAVEDASNANDACPCFTAKVPDGLIVLWVDHPEPEHRSERLDGARYTVHWGGDDQGEIYDGESLAIALAALKGERLISINDDLTSRYEYVCTLASFLADHAAPGVTPLDPEDVERILALDLGDFNEVVIGGGAQGDTIIRRLA